MTAQLVRRCVAGAARTVLPAVDHRDFEEVAVSETIVDAHHRPIGPRHDRPHRHMLVEGLIGGGAAAQEQFRIVVELGPLAGIVVRDFMVVPGDERRRLGVQAPQIGVEPVLRIAVAIGRQRQMCIRDR